MSGPGAAVDQERQRPRQAGAHGLGPGEDDDHDERRRLVVLEPEAAQPRQGRIADRVPAGPRPGRELRDERRSPWRFRSGLIAMPRGVGRHRQQLLADVVHPQVALVAVGRDPGRRAAHTPCDR